jgi:hypothetical protein
MPPDREGGRPPWRGYGVLRHGAIGHGVRPLDEAGHGLCHGESRRCRQGPPGARPAPGRGTGSNLEEAQNYDHDHTPPEALATFPESPASWESGPPGLLDSLAEATATGADEGTRYALNCLQLRGDTGEVAATDGRQLLVARGVPFPWTGDVLVRRSPVFASRDLPRDQPVAIGKTDTHVVFRVGP